MNSWPEFFTLVGSFVAAAFALVRTSLAQHRLILERFMSFLESNAGRQEEANVRFQEALEKLTDNVRENSSLLTRVIERIAGGGSR